MAVLQDQNQSSSLPPPSTAANNRGKLLKNGEKLFRKKSSGLTQSQKAKSIVLHANPMKPERSNKRKWASVESLFDDSQAQASVLARAKEVQANLNPQFPTFQKEMLRSHVTKGFWLGLPRMFCSEHMPREDTDIVLEDESGQEYVTKYLAEKMGLSGGWRRFSIEHKVEEGDVVIYQQVTCSRFKVYIVRLNDSDEMDSVLGLMRLNVCTNPMNTEEIVPHERDGSECLELTPKENAITVDTKSGPLSDQSESESKDLGLDFLDELTLSESDVTFEEVKCIGDFKVLVNGVIINSALKHILAKYYDLCRSQNSFLHEHLIDGLNCKLVVGAISEIVNIADAIRAYKITTSKDNFLTWERILKAFGDLGMNVGFLRTRLDQLRGLATKYRRFEEARLEKLQAEEELKRLEGKLLEVKQCIKRLDSEIGILGTSSEKFEDMFKKVAKAPW